MILTAFGVLLGVGVTALERSRARREAEGLRAPAWRVDHSHRMAYTLTNIGDATARQITLDADQADIDGVTEPFDLAPGEAQVFVAGMGLQSLNPQLLISWTSARGERLGPVRRHIPPDRLT